MIQPEFFIGGRVLERHRELGIFVLDQILARVAAAGADQSVEHQLQFELGAYQLTGPMIAQASARSSRE